MSPAGIFARILDESLLALLRNMRQPECVRIEVTERMLHGEPPPSSACWSDAPTASAWRWTISVPAIRR